MRRGDLLAENGLLRASAVQSNGVPCASDFGRGQRAREVLFHIDKPDHGFFAGCRRVVANRIRQPEPLVKFQAASLASESTLIHSLTAGRDADPEQNKTAAAPAPGPPGTCFDPFHEAPDHTRVTVRTQDRSSALGPPPQTQPIVRLPRPFGIGELVNQLSMVTNPFSMPRGLKRTQRGDRWKVQVRQR